MTLDELIKERDRLNEEIKQMRCQEIVVGRAKYRIKNEKMYQICMQRVPADRTISSTFTAIVENRTKSEVIKQTKQIIKDLTKLLEEIQKPNSL